MKPTLVVGAGITGLAAAVFLTRQGKSVEVWEEGEGGGGMLAPVEFQGVPCDRGSHRVHPESHPLLRELTASEGWLERERMGLLLLGQRQLSYPPNPFAFLRGLGPKTAMAMAWGFATRPNRLRAFRTWERDRSQVPETDDGFENFVVERVGRAAYEQFYRPYVEKVWGMNPSEISRTVAKTRVSTSNPLRTFRRALTPKAKTDRTFLYPKDGLGPLIQRLRKQAADAGVTFKNNQRFDADTPREAFESVFFSGHLGDLAPSAGLSHRGLYILHLAYPRGIVAENDTWYAPESRYWFGRVSQPSRFSPELQAPKHDILCVEIPEGRWGPEKDFMQSVEAVTEQLADAGILKKVVAPDNQRQTWLPKVYPMYRRGWLPQWYDALRQAEQLGNVYPIGRQGLFLHCNMDHCVHIAWEATQHVLNGGDATGWIARCPEFLDLRVRD